MKCLGRYLMKKSVYINYKFIKRFYTNRNILKLSERGMFNDLFPDNSTSKILDLFSGAPQTVYAGFDPTANSLHIGNLLVLINLIHWQRSGHQVIALIGGATGQIGDPSGKSTDRPEISSNTLNQNVEALSKNIEQVFSNYEEYLHHRGKFQLTPVKIVNNIEWYQSMNTLDFVGRVGRHFRLGDMLGKQSVRSRINSEEGMSFTEFTYQVFQAYDWYYLYKKFNCKFQIGGSDQMGNIRAGYDLIKKQTNEDVYGITLPIITTEEGDKYGKSAGNAIWLTETRTTPFQLYQFMLRTKDSEVEKLLKFFTFDSLGKIQELMSDQNKHPEKRLAQKRLAEDVTILVHGVKGLEKAQLISDILYSNKVDKLVKLNALEMKDIFTDANTEDLTLEPGLTVLDATMKAKCFQTEHDALRVISAGGLYINYQRVKNAEEVLTESTHILPNKISLIRVGKKNYTIVKWHN